MIFTPFFYRLIPFRNEKFRNLRGRFNFEQFYGSGSSVKGLKSTNPGKRQFCCELEAEVLWCTFKRINQTEWEFSRQTVYVSSEVPRLICSKQSHKGIGKLCSSNVFLIVGWNIRHQAWCHLYGNYFFELSITGQSQSLNLDIEEDIGMNIYQVARYCFVLIQSILALQFIIDAYNEWNDSPIVSSGTYFKIFTL